jgi:hypothetical protein
MIYGEHRKLKKVTKGLLGIVLCWVPVVREESVFDISK